MKISSIELPNTQFMFSATNYSNMFTITVNGDEQTITIPDGNYTIQEITTYIDSVINNKVSVNYDQPTGRIYFEYSSDVTSIFIDFNTAGAKYRQNCGWYLGFKEDTYTGTIGSSESIKADSIFGANFDKYLFVDVDDYQRNFLTGAVMSVTNRTGTGNSSYLGNTILAKIPITNVPNDIMFNNGVDQLFKTREYFGPVKLEKLRIRLLNKYGDVINLNNEDYSISIEITELY
jgi:hypothetical protein